MAWKLACNRCAQVISSIDRKLRRPPTTISVTIDYPSTPMRTASACSSGQPEHIVEGLQWPDRLTLDLSNRTDGGNVLSFFSCSLLLNFFAEFFFTPRTRAIYLVWDKRNPDCSLDEVTRL